jgi:hypothetical protein
MPKLMIILCQIIDDSLLATLNIDMASYTGVTWKQLIFKIATTCTLVPKQRCNL